MEDQTAPTPRPDVATFEGLVGQELAVVAGGPPFVLESVRRLPTSPGHPVAEPFALDLARDGEPLAQQSIELRHDTLGPQLIFVIPRSHADGVTRYEAIFN